MKLFIDFLETKIGFLKIVADKDHLREVNFFDHQDSDPLPNDLTHLTREQLTEYFKGSRKHFQLPLMPEGTAFQKRVWDKLLEIPYGKSASYLEIARRLGDEKTIRAAASANGKNPLAIIIPCHRVIGADGSLTGYAGGLHRKKWLLRHEKHPLFINQQLEMF